jgi:uncharacterized protein YcbX
LRIFPFKSLPGVDVSAATLTLGGGFSRDREFAMFDETGYVNGKRDPRVHALRVGYDEAVTRAHFTSTRTGERLTYELEDDPRALESWLARHFGRRIMVRRNCDGGFPDDAVAPGPTVISRATLAAVAGWFPGLDVDRARLRLRTNIELGDVPPFWEDRLYGGADTAVAVHVGDVILEGTNPCQRCVVPSRDPETGSPILGFAKRVAEQRAASLPAWANTTRFDHFYRLAVNTRPAFMQMGRAIQIGDAVARV